MNWVGPAHQGDAPAQVALAVVDSGQRRLIDGNEPELRVLQLVRARSQIHRQQRTDHVVVPRR
jgi:hypothetical protein